jgi:hypothetical protein
MAPHAKTERPSERSRLSTWGKRAGVVVASVALTGLGLFGTAGTALAGTTHNGGTYDVRQAEAISRNLLKGATVAGVGCGMHNLAKELQGNKAVGKTYLGAIAQKSAQAASHVAKSKGFCKSAAELLAAGTLVAYYANQTGHVYVMETTTTDTGILSKTVTYTYDVGPEPGDTKRFTSSTKVARWG